MFKKPFEKLLEDVWSTKDCQYVEVSDFGTLEKLFMERFVNDKRRSELFDALGIKYSERKRKVLIPCSGNRLISF